MKGLNISDTFWTLIFAVFLSVMIILGVFIWLQITVPFFSTAEPISYSIEFVHVVNQPFLLAEVLGHTKFDDRQFLEESIETMATSLNGAQAANLPGDLTQYMKNYNLKEYKISISRDSNELMSVESIRSKCGDDANNPEGWCVFGSCGVGRAEINPSALKCNAWQKCCKEDRTTGNGYNVVSCGPRGEGVCSAGSRPFYAGAYQRFWGVQYKYDCEQNRIDLGNPPECANANVNNGNTRACCAPQTEENQVHAGLAVKAVVPLLYKNSKGTLEVTAV